MKAKYGSKGPETRGKGRQIEPTFDFELSFATARRIAMRETAAASAHPWRLSLPLKWLSYGGRLSASKVGGWSIPALENALVTVPLT